jgi:serine/threonine protein kinase
VLGGDSELDMKAGSDGDDDEMIGVTLNDRYEVTRKLGQGGMGAVYEAKHTLIGKRVAVKVLLDKHAEKDQVVARLKQEARLASSIGHDNIVDITDFGITDAGRTFVVMEYLDGESLGEAIGKLGRIREVRAIHICSQIASALSAAHKKGIVHRDIKPDNIFLVQRGGSDFVKVVDFGISKSMDTESEDVRLTQTGMVLGTPLYMSPEQARGDDDLDHRIDIYALGVILYEAVTGEVPFKGKNYLNILTQVISDDPKSPSELFPDIDRDLESVIFKAMAKDRDQRYQSMTEIAADLEALSDPTTATTGARISAANWRKRRKSRSNRSYAVWALAVTGVASVSILAALLLMGGDNKREVAPPESPARVVVKQVAPPEAAPVPPVAVPSKTVTVKIESDPPGATVFYGDRVGCRPTPCDYKLPNISGKISLRVVLEGYQVGVLPIHPDIHDGKPVLVTLHKKPDNKKRGRRRHQAEPHSYGDTPPKAGTGKSGDTIGNPHSRNKDPGKE